MANVDNAGTTRLQFHYRVKVGVTGHRVLPQDSELAGRIQDVLTDIEQIVGPSGGVAIQWEILSSLADGADRLVAREVLKRGDARLRAVIPMMIAEYKTTFGLDAHGSPMSDRSIEVSHREFDELIADSRTRPVFLHGKPIAEDAAPAEATQKARHDAYREAGEYILRHCDFLIALVDPNRPKRRGGTHDILGEARKLRVPTYVIDLRQAPFPVRRKRLGHFDHSGIRAINAFAAPAVRKAGSETEFDEWLRPFRKSTSADLNAELLIQVEKRLIPYYTKASQLAKTNQHAYRTTGIAIYLFAIVAILLVTVGAMVEKWSLGFFTAEAIALAGIILLIGVARKQGYHRQWITLRFLAERLRAASFLTAVGVRPSQLRRGPAPTGIVAQCDWTAHVFNRIIAQVVFPISGDAAPLEAKRRFITEQWLRDQQRWHLRRAVEHIVRNRWFETLGSLLFYATLITAFVHAIAHMESRFLRQFATLAALAFPAIGAAFSWFRSHREYERLATRSREMSDQLLELAFEADTATEQKHESDRESPPMTQFENIVRRIDDIMLTESQDWRGLVRFLNVTKPH